MASDRSGATTDASVPSLAPQDLAPGAVVAARYRLEARLGRGGGGTVWRCCDEQLGAIVALKIAAAEGDVARWRREVAMARRIADRNVCRVHDLGETGELRFVTMELVEGTSLRHWVRGDLPAAEAWRLFAQVAAGAAAIHAAGVVHRDLKPENVVVATDGRAVIVDFGLAREPHRAAVQGGATLDLRAGSAERAPLAPSATVTHAGVAVGTPRYMAPEQAAGDAVDARADVWALGLIGHELLTGALPAFDAPGRRIDPLAEVRLPGASSVLARCLAADPADRYADARALHAALLAIDPQRHPAVASQLAPPAGSHRAAPVGSDPAPPVGSHLAAPVGAPPEPPIGALASPPGARVPSAVGGSPRARRARSGKRVAFVLAAAGVGAVVGGAILATRSGARAPALDAPASARAGSAIGSAENAGDGSAAGSVARTASGSAAHASAEPGPPATARAGRPTGEIELFPVGAEPRRWPNDAVVSVAVARDGQRFAYSTAGGDLRVQALAPGAAPDKWITPRFQRAPGAYNENLSMVWCAGWFGDGSLAVIGSTYRDGYQLMRVYRDGQATVLHHQAARFTAAVGSDDRIALAIDGDALFVLAPGGDPRPDQVARLEPGERVLAVAVSPDARRIAIARRAAAADAPLRIHVVTPGGWSDARGDARGTDRADARSDGRSDGGGGGRGDQPVRELWSGASAAGVDGPVGPLLVWLDGDALAFSRRDPDGGETVFTVDIAHPGEAHARGSGAGYAQGSAAAGTVVMLRTREEAGVQVGDARADHLVPVVANAPASHVAGWLAGGQLVFALGIPSRIVRAVPGRGAEPWPGTRAGVELPDTVAGDSVITHRSDAAAPADRRVVVERIDPAGRHHELARLPAERGEERAEVRIVRCAGDRAPPCMLREAAAGGVRWVEIDPATGARKRVLHSRAAAATPLGAAGAACDGALSPDGKTLAIVEATAELITVIDLAVGATRSSPASVDAALRSVAFAPDGDAWVTATELHGRPFGLAVFDYRAKSSSFGTAWSRGTPHRDVLRRFLAAQVSPDGKQVAVAVRDLYTEVVRVQGL